MPKNTLFVANACNNNIAVFDTTVPGKSRSLGFIPVGWYPTSVRVTPDGRHLLVANGKGLVSKAQIPAWACARGKTRSRTCNTLMNYFLEH